VTGYVKENYSYTLSCHQHVTGCNVSWSCEYVTHRSFFAWIIHIYEVSKTYNEQDNMSSHICLH